VIGTPVAGRTERSWTIWSGMFSYTWCCARRRSGQSFTALLRADRDTELRRWRHATSLRAHRRDLGRGWARATASAVPVALTVQDGPVPTLELPGLALRAEELDIALAKFRSGTAGRGDDLDTGIGEPVRTFEFVYAAELFDAAPIETLADRFLRVLAGPSLRRRRSRSRRSTRGPTPSAAAHRRHRRRDHPQRHPVRVFAATRAAASSTARPSTPAPPHSPTATSIGARIAWRGHDRPWLVPETRWRSADSGRSIRWSRCWPSPKPGRRSSRIDPNYPARPHRLLLATPVAGSAVTWPCTRAAARVRRRARALGAVTSANGNRLLLLDDPGCVPNWRGSRRPDR